jgi:integrase
VPRLPRSMFKRGPAFYLRQRINGKDVWKSLGPDFAKALDRYDRILTGKEDLSDALQGTVAELAERWLTLALPTRRTETGVRDVATRTRAYLVPFLGGKRVSELMPGHVREYRLHLERQKSKHTGRPFTPETVRHYLKDVQGFCSWLEEDGYVERSPFPKRVMPKIPDRGIERFTEAEVQRLVALPDPYGLTIRLALATGLRWGELAQVQASDVQSDGTLVVVQPKTGRIKRIPLPPDILKEIRGRVGKLVPFVGASKGSFTRAVKRRTGIAGVGSRLLRHTAACRSLEGGVRLDVIQRVLGHQSIVTTQRYARLGDATVRDELQRFWRKSVAAARSKRA